MATGKEIKNVKLFKGSGKSAEFLEAFETMPNEKKLKDFINQHYGHGFYYLSYHDGAKPQRKVIVLDRMQSRSMQEAAPVQFSGSKGSDGAEYLAQIVNADLRDIKNKLDGIEKDQQIIISLLKEAIEDVEEIQEDEKEESSVMSELLSKMSI